MAVDVGKYQLATSLGTKWPNLFMKTSVEGIRKGAKQRIQARPIRNKDYEQSTVRCAHCSGLKLILSGNVNKTATALKHNVVNKLNTITDFKCFVMVFS